LKSEKIGINQLNNVSGTQKAIAGVAELNVKLFRLSNNGKNKLAMKIIEDNNQKIRYLKNSLPIWVLDDNNEITATKLTGEIK